MTALSHWLLTMLLLVPLAGAVSLLFVRKNAAIYWTAVGASLLAFGLSILILLPFQWEPGASYQYAPAGMVQLQGGCSLVPSIHFRYAVAIDGLSLPMVLFATLMCVVACAVSRDVSLRRSRYFSFLLLLEFSVLGTLLSFDLLLFWFFSALLTLAAGALVAGWGGRAGRRAAIRMLVLLGFGVVCLLVTTIGTAVVASHDFVGASFDLIWLSGPRMQRLLSTQPWSATGHLLFVVAVLAFAVRLPVFPFHGWLVDVVSEAPAPVAVIIGAVIPLTGCYGLLRVAGPLFTGAAASFWALCAALALISSAYCGLCAMAQDQKRPFIAYGMSSLAASALLGFAVRTPTGADGAVLIVLSSGLVAALLLLNVSSAGQPAYVAVGWILWLVAPGMLSEMIVLLGVLQAIRADSGSRMAGTASPAAIYVTAAATCLMILLSGLSTARFLYRRFAIDRATEPAAAEADSTPVAVGVCLAIIAMMLGLLPIPLCLFFTHRALLPMMHAGG